MTTKPTYQIITEIDYDSLEFDPNECEPLPEGMEQNPIILRIIQMVETHLNTLYPPESVFIDTNTPICYNPANLNNRAAPDLGGGEADLVLEDASHSTARNGLVVQQH